MIKNIDSLFKRFRKSTDGNFGIMMAVALAVIVFVVAVAIDSSRLMQASSKLKALTDNATLAAAGEQNVSLARRKEIFEEMMEVGLANSPELSGLDYTLTYENDGTSSFLTVTSSSEANIFFPQTRAEGRFVGALSEVVTGKEDIEIALVLDISNSMAGAKIVELQSAATNFIQTLLQNASVEDGVSISIVPFGGSVRLPSDLEFMLGTPHPTENWAAHWTNGKWNGCVSADTVDFKSGVAPQDRLGYIPDFTSYRNRNSWCPPAGNEMVGLTQNRSGLIDKIADLTLSSGTAIDIGVTWGLATLDVRWRGQMRGVSSVAPRNFSAQTHKIMVVMADGGITAQNFPDNAQLARERPPYHTNNRKNTEAQATDQYEEVCDLVKFKGIEVYTVGFDLNQRNDIDTLQYCGTSEAHNFEADTGELNIAFDRIAKSISTLRLSR